MDFPKNDKEIRMFCLVLASENDLSSEHIDMDKAEEYYKFITASSKPSARRMTTLALSRWRARLCRLFHRR